MKTRSNLIVSFSALLFFFCFVNISLGQNQALEPFQKIEGYQLNAAKNPGNGNFAQLIFRQNQFDKFYLKNPKATKVSKIDFENQTVISLTGVKVKENKVLTIEKVIKNNQKISIYFISQKGKKAKEFIVPYCIYTIKRDSGIRAISYYLDGQLLEEVKN